MDYESVIKHGLVPAMAAGLGVVVFLLVWLPMRRLLGANSRLKRARPFFVRTLLLVLLLGAIAPAIDKSLDLDGKSKAAKATTQAQTAAADTLEHEDFMQAVWQAAGELEGSFIAAGLYLFGFVVIMAILAATLGKYRDE